MDLLIICYDSRELKSALEAVEVLPCSNRDYIRKAHLAHLSHSIALPKLQSFKSEKNNKKECILKGYSTGTGEPMRKMRQMRSASDLSAIAAAIRDQITLENDCGANRAISAWFLKAVCVTKNAFEMDSATLPFPSATDTLNGCLRHKAAYVHSPRCSMVRTSSIALWFIASMSNCPQGTGAAEGMCQASQATQTALTANSGNSGNSGNSCAGRERKAQRANSGNSSHPL